MCHSSRCTSGLWTSRADTISLSLGITCCHIKTQTTQGCWISYVVVFAQKPVGFSFHPPQCAAKHYPWNIEEEVVTLKIYRSVHSSTDCLCNTNLLAYFHWALVPPTHLQPFVWMEMITFLLPFFIGLSLTTSFTLPCSHLSETDGCWHTEPEGSADHGCLRCTVFSTDPLQAGSLHS